MKKIALIVVLAAAWFTACQENRPETNQQTSAAPQNNTFSVAGLQLRLDANPEWQYENLRIYPVVAEAGFIAKNSNLPELKTLAEAMASKGFSITEKKQFGREDDRWYNALTVQNKTRDTVFLMSGAVVTGGNQDRVIAYDDIILPGTLKNIEVFCVESCRSHYYDESAPESEKRVAAFRGYYNVASPRVRQAVHSGNQQGVWDAVARVTADNQATSTTNTYAALETENDQKTIREAYLHFFEGKLMYLPNVVGMVAVCNGRVIGVDIFGKPELFQRQYLALMHGYAADAAVSGRDTPHAEPPVKNAFAKVAGLAAPESRSTADAGRFAVGEQLVHLFNK